MARDGLRFVVPAAVVTIIALWLAMQGHLWAWPIGTVAFIITAFLAYFFRDPDRVPPDDPAAIVATADGTILEVVTGPDGSTRIDTFLSVWDVHVNRAPVSGRVVESRRQPGRFLIANKTEAGSQNERHDLVIQSDMGVIRSAQIAGILARRIVCRPAAGDQVQKGERIGLIRFGSRASVTAPPGFAAMVRRGDKVRAGETVMARGRDTTGEPDARDA